MKAKDFYQYIFSNVSQILPEEKELQPLTSIIFKHFVSDEFSLPLNKEISNLDHNLLGNIFCRLKKNEPIQYILQETFFLNLELFVDENVLIPRPETEEMVSDIYKNFDSNKKNILDIGTGSGCIALALKKKFVNVQVDAIDINSKSLEVARRNAKKNNLEINFMEKDILRTEILEQEYDLIVSNPPYVCASEKIFMSDRVLNFEPSTALFVEDKDPSVFYKKIISLAEKSLNAKGLLFLEINEKFGKEIIRLLFNFQNVIINKDINGKDRWIRAEFLK
ncbi:MAG: peptide chain release factor N(5)-glutamine methyltransferase [Cytophagales bacterium]|jgi:release factor glutamine methyltransferase|nr:peptide chain release factor N(5)-glutamine methyltransferase [Cytophagales bacterium]